MNWIMSPPSRVQATSICCRADGIGESRFEHLDIDLSEGEIQRRTGIEIERLIALRVVPALAPRQVVVLWLFLECRHGDRANPCPSPTAGNAANLRS
jgi:hypothetical protein